MKMLLLILCIMAVSFASGFVRRQSYHDNPNADQHRRNAPYGAENGYSHPYHQDNRQSNDQNHGKDFSDQYGQYGDYGDSYSDFNTQDSLELAGFKFPNEGDKEYAHLYGDGEEFVGSDDGPVDEPRLQGQVHARIGAAPDVKTSTIPKPSIVSANSNHLPKARGPTIVPAYAKSIQTPSAKITPANLPRVSELKKTKAVQKRDMEVSSERLKRMLNGDDGIHQAKPQNFSSAQEVDEKPTAVLNVSMDPNSKANPVNITLVSSSQNASLSQQQLTTIVTAIMYKLKKASKN